MERHLQRSATVSYTHLDVYKRQHVYSVDECFIDVTNYLQLYHLTAKEMAVKLMREVMEETGITATAGVGTVSYTHLDVYKRQL